MWRLLAFESLFSSQMRRLLEEGVTKRAAFKRGNKVNTELKVLTLPEQQSQKQLVTLSMYAYLAFL